MLEQTTVEKIPYFPNPEEFPGFRVFINFIPVKKQQEITQACMESPKGTSRGRRAINVQMNMPKYRRMMVESGFSTWEGLRPEYIEKMLPVTEQAAKVFVENGNGEITYSNDAATFLAVNAADADFFGPIMEMMTEWSQYREAQERLQEKNYED